MQWIRVDPDPDPKRWLLYKSIPIGTIPLSTYCIYMYLLCQMYQLQKTYNCDISFGYLGVQELPGLVDPGGGDLGVARHRVPDLGQALFLGKAPVNE